MGLHLDFVSWVPMFREKLGQVPNLDTQKMAQSILQHTHRQTKFLEGYFPPQIRLTLHGRGLCLPNKIDS